MVEDFIYYIFLLSNILFFHVIITKYMQNIFHFSMCILYYGILFILSKTLILYNCEYIEKYTVKLEICRTDNF